ncbi:MAG TPA: hypothetical protein VLF94_04875 [Chlamydiales bacterium]|nr:hypothetical protein [Chlamydiales bacterium]
MNTGWRLAACLFFCCLRFVHADDRSPYPPYITGDAFRYHCDFIIDETNQKLDCSKIDQKCKIFVKTEMVPYFFKTYHHQIPVKYVLVSHNSDQPAPGPSGSYLDDDKILAWFAQNVEVIHPKLRPIPIGLENRYCPNGEMTLISGARQRLQNQPKTTLAYLNFSTWTCPSVRQEVLNLFQHRGSFQVGERKPYLDYLSDVASSLFVLSPRGNGLDCVRTWETLYMKTIPVVKTSASDSLFDGLPVLIVDDWTTVTEDFLHRKYQEISQKPVFWEKLNVEYWLEQIDEALNEK